MATDDEAGGTRRPRSIYDRAANGERRTPSAERRGIWLVLLEHHVNLDRPHVFGTALDSEDHLAANGMVADQSQDASRAEGRGLGAVDGDYQVADAQARLRGRPAGGDLGDARLDGVGME